MRLVNRLRTRLVFSYVAVVMITLLVTALLLVVLLRNRPVAADPIFTRLVGISRVLNQRDALASLLVAGQMERVEQSLNAVASRMGARILLVDDPGGDILYDSLGVLQDAGEANFNVWGPVPGMQDVGQGAFWQEGEEWLFVAQPLQTRQRQVQLVFAAPRPQSSWREVLNIFGNSLLLPLLQAGIIALLVAILLGWLSSRGQVKSLGRLAGAAQAVAAGDYHEHVPLKGADEVQAVAAAFNHMAEQVQANQQAQQEFLANVSHDLRTPLTSIQGFSQAIIDGTSQDPAYHARIIYDEAGRLNRMVGELLDLARISSGRLSMRQGRVIIGQIAGAVTERLMIKAQQKGVQLLPTIQPTPEIAGDGDRLAQVLTNLIDNAIKFTPSGGTVRVLVEQINGGVQLTVSDTGKGIPAEDLPRIFERFYQVDKARGPRRGTGLGLAITAEIVRAHGGQIRVSSAGAGQGTTFAAWFPALGMSTVVRIR